MTKQHEKGDLLAALDIEHPGSDGLDKLQRKAALAEAEAEAKEKREAFAKDGEFSHRAVITDILRVAEHPLNPYPGTCSRARYRKLGWFDEGTIVADLFGNFEEAQREAGLRDTRETSAQRNRRARLRTEERIHEYATKWVAPWAGRYDSTPATLLPDGSRWALVASDLHGKSVDATCLAAFIDTCRRTQPAYIVLNGDVVDFWEVGKWSKNPHRLLDLQGELDFVRDRIFAPLRAACPAAQIDYIIGNHEFRLVKFLADAAPGLASLRCLELPNLLGLDEYQINLVWRDPKQLTPTEAGRRQVVQQNYTVYDECFLVTHGSSHGQSAAMNELKKSGYSGTSGHVHKPSYTTMSTVLNPDADWTITPMMAGHEVGAEYVQGHSPWFMGFGSFQIFPEAGVVLPQLHIKKGSYLHAFGVTYSDK